MPWTTPITKSTGDGLTAADWNTYVRDNAEFLYAPPRVDAYHSTDQSIANASDTFLAFDSERYDTDTMHSTVTNNSRVTVNTAGLYVVSAGVEFASNSTGSRQIVLVVNGSQSIAVTNTPSGATLGVVRLNVATTWVAAAGDYFQAQVYQDSGGALNALGVQPRAPFLRAAWVGA